MLPKKVNCQSNSTEFYNEDIEKIITIAECSADRALRNVIKRENYITKRKRRRLQKETRK